VPDRPTDLGWARTEPFRSIRYALQKGMLIPFTEAMAHPTVEGEEWVQDLDRPVIIASNHTSHADTPLLLYALGDRVRERTVVAAAADYFYDRRLIGFLTSLWLNTFPFSRTGSPREVLHRSGQLLKSGWNLLVFPEGTRSTNGALQEFTPGVGHLASENRVDVVPMHLRGSHRIMPKGPQFPAPGESDDQDRQAAKDCRGRKLAIFRRPGGEGGPRAGRRRREQRSHGLLDRSLERDRTAQDPSLGVDPGRGPRRARRLRRSGEVAPHG